MTCTPFPVFYASIQTIPGCMLTLNTICYFAPIDDEKVYVITDTTALIVTGKIEEPMASYVRQDLATKLYNCDLDQH